MLVLNFLLNFLFLLDIYYSNGVYRQRCLLQCLKFLSFSLSPSGVHFGHRNKQEKALFLFPLSTFLSAGNINGAKQNAYLRRDTTTQKRTMQTEWDATGDIMNVNQQAGMA